MKVKDLFEALDVSIHDTLEHMEKYRAELQAELKDETDAEIKDTIEQDIYDISAMISTKQSKGK